MLSQLLEQICTPTLHRKQQEAEEVEERERGVDTHVGAGAADFLHAERFVGASETGSEDEVSFVGGAQIASEKIREDGTSSIKCGCMRIVLGVPLVLEIC